MSATRRLKRQTQISEAKRLRKAHRQAWVKTRGSKAEIEADDDIRLLVEPSAYSEFSAKANKGVYEVLVGTLFDRPLILAAKSKHELANQVREWFARERQLSSAEDVPDPAFRPGITGESSVDPGGSRVISSSPFLYAGSRSPSPPA